MTTKYYEDDAMMEDLDAEDFDAAEDYDEALDETDDDYDDDEAFDDDDDDEAFDDDDDEAFDEAYDEEDDDDDEAFDDLAEDFDEYDDDDDEGLEELGAEASDEGLGEYDDDDDESFGEDSPELSYSARLRIRRRRAARARMLRARRRRAQRARMRRRRNAARRRAANMRRQARLRRRIRSIRPNRRVRVRRAPTPRPSRPFRAVLPNGATTKIDLKGVASRSALKKLSKVSNANAARLAKTAAKHGKALAKLRSSLASASGRLTKELAKVDKALTKRLATTEKKLETRIRKEVNARKVEDRKTRVRGRRALRRERMHSLADTLAVGTAVPVYGAKWDSSKGYLEGNNLKLNLALFGGVVAGWGGSKLLGDSAWAAAPKAIPLATLALAGGLLDAPITGTQLKTTTIALGSSTSEEKITGITSSSATVHVLEADGTSITPEISDGTVRFTADSAVTASTKVTYLVSVS